MPKLLEDPPLVLPCPDPAGGGIGGRLPLLCLGLLGGPLRPLLVKDALELLLSGSTDLLRAEVFDVGGLAAGGPGPWVVVARGSRLGGGGGGGGGLGGGRGGIGELGGAPLVDVPVGQVPPEGPVLHHLPHGLAQGGLPEANSRLEGLVGDGKYERRGVGGGGNVGGHGRVMREWNASRGVAQICVEMRVIPFPIPPRPFIHR